MLFVKLSKFSDTAFCFSNIILFKSTFFFFNEVFTIFS
jgi:hypothetical protein